MRPRRLGGAIAQTGQSLDIRPAFPLGHAKLVELLQVQPELGARTKEVSQTQRRIARYCTLSVEDMRDPICRYLELTCQLRRAHLERLELLGEMFARMNYLTRHKSLL